MSSRQLGQADDSHAEASIKSIEGFNIDEMALSRFDASLHQSRDTTAHRFKLDARNSSQGLVIDFDVCYTWRKQSTQVSLARGGVRRSTQLLLNLDAR